MELTYMRLIFSLAASLGIVLGVTAQSTLNSSHAFPDHYTQHAFHADFVQLSPEECDDLADVVFEGEVLSTRSIWRGHHMYSELDIIDEDGVSRTVQLVGGALAGVGSFCTGEMYLNAGAKGTFYLRSTSEGQWEPACGVQSFKPEHVVETMGLARNSLQLSSQWSAGNADQFLTVSGAGFGNVQGNGYVTFDAGGAYYEESAADGFNYTTWTDSSVTVQVPKAFSNTVQLVNDAGSVMQSSDSLHIGYNLDGDPSGMYGHTHLLDLEAGGLVFHVNTQLHEFPERLEAIERTLEDFVCKTGVNFQLAEDATSAGWDLGDGQHTISFDDIDAPLSPSTVAFCHTLWSSCIMGGVTFYHVEEIDIVLNDDYDYSYDTGPAEGEQAKFAYVLMHEFGHAMRLGHVNEWGETMFPSVTDSPSNGWSGRDTISTWDQVGVGHAVELASSFTFDGCGLSSMIPLDVDCATDVAVFNVPGRSLEYRLFPNPTRGTFRISGVPINEPVQVTVYDMWGRLLMTTTYNGGEALILPPNLVTKGVYTVQIQGRSFVDSCGLILQ
ncbi:MAG: zinc-dependent metalloprotease [Flavobacteriales bacterium]|nr:zinc-dependent metalloprotease [Flavobacteriales bacterium]